MNISLVYTYEYPHIIRLESPISSLLLAPTDTVRGELLLFAVDNNDRLYVRQLSNENQSPRTARAPESWSEVSTFIYECTIFSKSYECRRLPDGHPHKYSPRSRSE